MWQKFKRPTEEPTWQKETNCRSETNIMNLLLLLILSLTTGKNITNTYLQISHTKQHYIYICDTDVWLSIVLTVWEGVLQPTKHRKFNNRTSPDTNISLWSAGCAAYGDDEDVLMACKQGWVRFTCKYPEANKKYDHVNVVIPNGTSLRSSLKDVWEDKGRFSLYHDTKHKTLMVGIRDLKQGDFGMYRCESDQRSNRSPVIKKLEYGKKCDYYYCCWCY